MSFHRRKDGYWYVQYYPGRVQKRIYLGKGPNAKLAAQELDSRIKRGYQPGVSPAPLGSPTFFDIAHQYLELQPLNHRTRESMRTSLNKWVKGIFAHKYISELSMTDLMDLDKAMVHAGRAFATRNRIRSYCKFILNWGIKNDLIETNPFSRFSPQRSRESPGPYPPTLEELNLTWQHAPFHLRWAIFCMVHLGVRPGPTELFGIHIEDVDFERQGIYLTRQKTHSRRRLLPCHPEFMAAVKSLITSEPKRQYLIEYKGKPVKSLKRTWGSTPKKAGISRRIRLYDIRHYYATVLLRSGADLKAVSSLMGHASPDMTLRVYYHLLEEQERKALERLPEFVPNRDKNEPI